ncbi:hypothetical protein QTJ16_001356 [Diplocarpon rosae]|uniref:NAD(P)-binding protein n=1 Tax=Diplocarpon rosae TaxID=946125 RepID=A0AAD9T7A6_9HELO|nr:hypothetical protein QTJ16_001356 [Diplocarpon rosae]PBP28910.1 putative short-chain dehydrogenase/reductase [Diplocarpon rosae]
MPSASSSSFSSSSTSSLRPQTWLVIGASRGIGLEFTAQLLALGHTVIATARSPALSLLPLLAPQPASSRPPSNASKLWSLTGGPNGRNLTILECDVADEGSIRTFAHEVSRLARGRRLLLDVVVMSAGVRDYPGRVVESSFASFADHLHTNTIGPLVTAAHLLSLSVPSASSRRSSPLAPPSPTAPIHIRTLVFISSDSSSATTFRACEDGSGLYAASKAALNQGLRHLAAELHRKRHAPPTGTYQQHSPLSISSLIEKEESERTVVLALHPGGVATEMANVNNLNWGVEGIISARESVKGMLAVIAEKGWGGSDEGGTRTARMEGRREEDGAATFWTWQGLRYPW